MDAVETPRRVGCDAPVGRLYGWVIETPRRVTGGVALGRQAVVLAR